MRSGLRMLRRVVLILGLIRVGLGGSEMRYSDCYLMVNVDQVNNKRMNKVNGEIKLD